MKNHFTYRTNSLLCILLTLAQITPATITKPKSKLCFTKDCIIAAATMIKNMDTEVHPCTNFYEFACGLYSEHTFIGTDKIMVNINEQKYEQYLAEVKSLLDSPKRFSEPEAVWKAKDFFFACMNETYPADDSALKYIAESLGGFPLLVGDAWESNNFNWLDMATYLHRNGFQHFGFFAFGQNIFQAEEPRHGKYQIIIGAGKAAITRMFPSIFLNRRYSEAHPNITSAILNLIRELAPEDKRNHTVEVKKLIQFAVDIENGPDGETLVLPLSELKRIAPEVKWNTILDRVFNKKLDNSTAILIKDFQRLKRIIKFAFITEKRTIANYVILNLLFSLYQQQELTKYLALKIKLTFFKQSGAQVESPSQELISCIQHAGYLSGAVEAMYFKKFLTPDIQYTALKMENAIRDQFVKSIGNSSYWSDVVRLLKTNASLVTDIGATINVLDDLNLDFAYSEMSSHRSDHFVNVLARKRFNKLLNFRQYNRINHALESLRLIRKLRENRVTYFGNIETGITYIGIPPTLLRGIIFSERRDPSLNFGSLGIKIMEGLLLYLRNNDVIPYMHRCFFFTALTGFSILPRSIVDKFQDMRLCMAKQYDENDSIYPEAKYAIRSTADKSTLSTQMAEELIAVRTAYNTFQKWVQVRRLESHQLLPTINANRNQLFWISYATINCDVYDEEALMNSKDPPGFPHKIKVLNVIRNAPEFAKDFHCANTAYMNIENRCKLLYE